MLRYKPVTVEKLICICDRCGRVMDQDSAGMEWQERFIISFRAGYGSVFGDGNFIEGDFCQECIHAVLGKWLRITDDDPFDSKHKPVNDAEKILQPYQFEKEQEGRRRRQEFTEMMKGCGEREDKRKQLAERLGVAEEQIGGIALDYLLQALDIKPTAEEGKDEMPPVVNRTTQ